VSEYPDRAQAEFVRDWRPEIRDPISEALKNPNWEHSRAVSHLQTVPFKIDPRILDVVRRHAVDILEHRAHRDGREFDEHDKVAAKRTVGADLLTAEKTDGQSFYLPHNCDSRGRVFPTPHFNYQREDHVRALFRFANGKPLGEGLEWLEIHCANSFGIDKKPWNERQAWVADNRREIERTAADPDTTIDWWKNADKPFAFVSACFELVAAWADPRFVTHLPVSFDGTCNGIQHLALLSRDPDAARLVNLADENAPNDVYSKIAERVVAALAAASAAGSNDPEIEAARWWIEQLGDKKQARRIVKRPAMTYAYSATIEGMAEHIEGEYPACARPRRKRRRHWLAKKPRPSKKALCLARAVRTACAEELRGPALVMRFIRNVAKHCNDREEDLHWTSPTGFPVFNRYREKKTKRVDLILRGKRVTRKVTIGEEAKILKREAIDSSAPNFVHSMDAAHLVRLVNASVSEDIGDIVTVHDSFSCHAPYAVRFNQIIRRELAIMYDCDDPLGALARENGVNEKPPSGTLDPLDVQKFEYCWM
jgi:DNA-directed RNA polymerase